MRMILHSGFLLPFSHSRAQDKPQIEFIWSEWTQLVSLGCRNRKEIKKGPRYNHFVATGDLTPPKEDNRDRDRSRRPPAISAEDLAAAGPSSGQRGDRYQGPPHRREDSNGRDRSANRHRSRSGARDDLRNILSPRRGNAPSRGRGRRY